VKGKKPSRRTYANFVVPAFDAQESIADVMQTCGEAPISGLGSFPPKVFESDFHFREGFHPNFFRTFVSSDENPAARLKLICFQRSNTNRTAVIGLALV
jgi:hypothetical protein